MRFRSLLVIMTLMITNSVLVNGPVVAEELCPKYDLQSLFDEEYFPDLKWDNTSGNRTIKWTTNVTVVAKEPITRPMTADELVLLRQSFNAWDMALDTIKFEEVNDPAQADIRVGLKAIQNNGYWTLDEYGSGFREKGTVSISTTTPVFLTPKGFETIALSEIGNLMGLGDIQHPVGFHSVMEDPDTPPFGVIPLEDADIDMMRQFYGETTCHSSWSPELKAAKAEAAAKAKAEAEAAAAKAKAEAEAAAAKAEADRIAAIQAEAAKAAAAAAAKAAATKKTTITCVKGKVTKKVTAVNPTCPSGYKRK